MTYDGSIRISTILNTLGLRRGENEIRGSMDRISNAAKKMFSVVASAFAIGTVAKFGKEAIQAASDLEAMESQFSQVFGNMESAAAESLSGIAAQAGITEERMKASYTKIAAFAKTTGMDVAGSMELANRAMVAVADSAAFYDRSLEETTESLQSFLKGNYENDAALGLSATEFTRNAAANKLYGKSFIELSEAQKQLTLLQMVEDANALSGALGQASREADTWTNQTGNLSQAWTNLKANLGKLVLPIAVQAVKSVTNVINAINAMVSRLTTAASAFRSFSELITGKKSSAGAGVPDNGMKDSAEGYNSAADAAESLADSTGKVAKATKDAKKAAAGYLSGLDEIRRYGEDMGASGAGSEPEAGVSTAPTHIDVDYGSLAEGETAIDRLGSSIEPLIEKIKELAGLFKKGFFDGLGDYKPRIEELKKDILSIGETLKDIFADPEVVSSANRFVNQLSYTLGQVAGSVASIGITIAQNLVGGIEKYLTQNTDRIKNYIVSMFDIKTKTAAIIGDFSVSFADIFSVFGGDTAQQITANLIGIFSEVGMLISENAAKLGRDILNMITKPIIDNKDKIKDAIEGTLQSIEPFTSGLLTAVQTVRDAISDVYDNHLKPLFDSIANGLSEILGKLLDGYNEYMVPVLQGLGDRFKELMEGPFMETVEKVKDFIGKLIDAIKLLWEKVLVPFFGWIADNIMPVLAPIVEYLGSGALNLMETVIKVVGDISDILGGFIDFIVGVFTGDWKKAWGGVKQIFEGAWNLIKDIVNGSVKEVKNIMKLLDGWLGDVFSKDWSESFGGFGDVLNGFFKGFSDIWDSVKKIFGGIIKFIDGVFSGDWEKAWGGIKDIFGGIWDGFVAVVKSPINAIIGVLNGLIEGMSRAVNGIADMLNSLRIDIPDWVPGIGGGTLGFNLPKWNPGKIPYLATGAVIPPNREFLAVLGDQKHGTNVEAPLSTIEQAVENVLKRNNFNGNNRNNSSGGNIIHNNIQINRRTLLDEMIEEAKLRQTKSGTNPFSLA